MCVQQTCIDNGNLRFTLTWTGNDDLDIYVMTPGGVLIFFGNPTDPVSGGTIDTTTTQLTYGEHVENVVFNSTPPTGVYKYYTVPFVIRGTPDVWMLGVYVNGTEVAIHQGTASSPMFNFTYP